MRFFISALLALVFFASFIAFFLLSSVVTFVDSPDGWVATVEKQELRADIISLTSEYIAAEVAADSDVGPMASEELEVLVGGVITKEWFRTSILSAHAALRSAFHGAEKTAVLDLRGMKQSFREALASLKVQARESCQKLWGKEICADLDISQQLVGSFETQALQAIDQIADEVDLLKSLQGRERRTARQLNQGLKSLETTRLIALIVLIVSLLLLIARAARSFRTLALSAGLFTIAASVLYLIAVAIIESFAQQAAVASAGSLNAAGTMDAKLQQLTGELTSDLVGAAMSGSTTLVIAVGVGAFLLVSLVLIVGRGGR